MVFVPQKNVIFLLQHFYALSHIFTHSLPGSQRFLKLRVHIISIFFLLMATYKMAFQLFKRGKKNPLTVEDK